MTSTLVFPDGIRLAHREEIPGPEPAQDAGWARVESANIAAGFTLAKSNDIRFTLYAEVNVDAPRVWAVFCDLCQSLLGVRATLVASEIDDEPAPLGSANTYVLLGLLELHQYQLAHDGWIQFGLIGEGVAAITEVFVAPTKHLQVWVNDEQSFRSIMRLHNIPEANQLEFLDEFPRTTIRLPEGKVLFQDSSLLIEHFEKAIKALPTS